MVECPRCGFIQPDDRYCANCGLDSLNYTPKPVPLFLRIINNTGVQLTAALLIVASLIFGLYKNQQNHLELAINKAEEAQRQSAVQPTVSAKILPARPAIESAKPASTELAKETEATETELAAREKSVAAEEVTTTSTPMAATTTGSTPSASPAAEVEGKPIPFTVTLVEVGNDILEGLKRVAPVRSWSGTRAWLITNFQGGEEVATYSQNLPAGKSWGIDIPNQERGLKLQVSPLQGSNDNHLKVSVKIYFRWPSERAGETKSNEVTIEGPFDIPSQNHLIITGFLRRIKNITMTEATLIQGTPLSILATENFQVNQTSDLALTIQ